MGETMLHSAEFAPAPQQQKTDAPFHPKFTSNKKVKKKKKEIKTKKTPQKIEEHQHEQDLIQDLQDAIDTGNNSIAGEKIYHSRKEVNSASDEFN